MISLLTGSEEDLCVYAFYKTYTYIVPVIFVFLLMWENVVLVPWHFVDFF